MSKVSQFKIHPVNIMKELGEVDRAINSYQRVIQIQPNHANAHYNLGLLYINL